jgi:hypothetical protein
LEANPEVAEAVVERQELHRCMVVRRRRWAKKRTQNSVGFRQKLSAARKRHTLRAVPALRKGYVRKGLGKKKSTRRIVEVPTF